MYDRAGHPDVAFVFGLLDDGRRTLATADDTAVVEMLVADDPLGRTATVRAGTLLGVA
jgi:hypothetical protein